MRDPLENKQWTFPAGYVAKDDESTEVHERAYFEFHHLAAEIFDQAHLLALTIDTEYPWPDELFGRGWARARMWEQYAEAHKGVCLMFDRERLTEHISADLHRQLNVRPYEKPVEYTPRGGELTLNLNEFPTPVAADFVRTFIQENHHELFFKKTLDWETEHEYRFATTAPPGEPLYADYGDALVGIIVGEKFPGWQRTSAIESGRQVGLEPQLMLWDNSHPVPVALRLKPPPEEGPSQAPTEHPTVAPETSPRA